MSTDADAVDNNSSTNNATNKLINNHKQAHQQGCLVDVDIVSDWNNDNDPDDFRSDRRDRVD
jgi:hypothetical protein